MKSNKVKYHLFFEQSGTFKNEFKKLGYEAYDYDILNMYNETDFVMDLYDEIEKGFLGLKSVFDKIEGGQDTILAFFPCIRFEQQILLHFRGDASQMKNMSDLEKLCSDLKLHDELHKNYNLITKLAIVCLRKNIPLIIENPFSEQHYLRKYWCLKPKVVDMNRRENGDNYIKPTQYWFINCEPKRNFIFEPLQEVEHKLVDDGDTVERSMINPQYANRFIREFIIEEKEGD